MQVTLVNKTGKFAEVNSTDKRNIPKNRFSKLIVSNIYEIQFMHIMQVTFKDILRFLKQANYLP